MEDVSIIGIELAKRDFQVDGPKAEGRLPTAAYPMCNMGAWRGLRPPSIPPKVALRGREWMAIASAMMTGEGVGVGHDPSRGAAYVEGWVAALEEDPREIRRAAADAQKVSDFVLARSRERQAEREPVAVAATRAPDPQHAARPVRSCASCGSATTSSCWRREVFWIAALWH